VMTNTQIDQENLADYLKNHFSDRSHAPYKHVLEIMDELSREDIRNIEDLEALVKKYPPNEYLSKMEHEMGFRLADVGVIRSLLVASKIDEINGVINRWQPPLMELPDSMDEKPFVDIGRGITSYLMKSEDKIKIKAANVEELLEISFDELGNRIGTGLPYLRRLESRLEEFRKILLLKKSNIQ
jgi:hypothetical protein